MELNSQLENELIIKHIASPDKREKLYRSLFTKMEDSWYTEGMEEVKYYAFTYWDPTKSHYLRHLYQCSECKRKWTQDELEHVNSCCDECSYWAYECPYCRHNLGDTVQIEAEEYHYPINNIIVYSTNKEAIKKYRENKVLKHTKKIRKVYWYEKERIIWSNNGCCYISIDRSIKDDDYINTFPTNC